MKTIDGIHIFSILSGLQQFPHSPGVYTTASEIDPNYLRPGKYTVDLVIWGGKTNTYIHDIIQSAATFEIQFNPQPDDDPRYAEENRDLGVVRFDYTWGAYSRSE